MLRLILLISLLISFPAYGKAIGNVVQHKGVASVERDKKDLPLQKNSEIMFKDTVKTGNGDIGITFVDKTNVAVSSQSSLVIDEFVYDPNSKSGSKLVMNVALGTVRYASGNIAKLNSQSVDIRTPTARIGVRGTAFSMTVDEVGKSLVILLPNADGTVGEISVESDAGQVILNKAFQATVVGTTESKPSPSVILDLTLDQINNLLIIKPPKEILKQQLEESSTQQNLLDIDLLEYKELDKNELEKDELAFGLLDINELDIDLLQNVLDQVAMVYSQSEMVDGRTPGLNKATQVTTVIEGQETRIIRQVGSNNVYLILNNDYGYKINIEQGGVQVPEITTKDEDVSNSITIRQSGN